MSNGGKTIFGAIILGALAIGAPLAVAQVEPGSHGLTINPGRPHTDVKPNPNAGLPEWLAGTWTMEQGSKWADEVWTSPRGGMMLGLARTGFGPNLESWENTRIIRKLDGSISLFAQSEGKLAVEFPLAVSSAESVEFANASHDFPQRIRYWRQGQLLIAEISKIDGSEAVRWNYRPVEVGVN
jgi:hypothetical protein